MDRSEIDILSHGVSSVARYVHDNGYEGVLISGRSTIMSEQWFRKVWAREYKGKNSLEYFIFDPKGNALLHKDLTYTGHVIGGERETRVLVYLEENFPKLLKMKDKKLCYVTEYSSRAKKITRIKYIFERLGFTNFSAACFISEAEIADDIHVGVVDANIKGVLYEIYRGLVGEPSIFDARQALREIDAITSKI
ncbi:MAG: hypothetical protein HY831_01025 [Candidatus Aenigmarchaeota archaeon]|nr:hypothetical protein [Candidatus Aenigmarchaeota archaeon]